MSASPFIRSISRIYAVVLRYFYLIRGSWTRVLELMYWPFVNLIVWGFISKYFATHSSVVAQAAGILLGAVLLWDVLFRGQMGVSISFMEEMWSRNFANMFVTPLRPYEFVIGILCMSFIRIIICVGPAMLLAIPFYGYSIFDLGLPLLFFFVNLMAMGWWLGLIICGLLLRLGMGAESLAWACMFLLAPFAGVYYPISTLPEILQYAAWSLPSAYVFEGMRSIMLEQYVPWPLLFKGMALNAAYMIAGTVFFLIAFDHARKEGRLMQIGE